MKRLFLDTNILIDLIADRKPYSKYAEMLFKGAEQKKIKLFASSLSIATTHYILKKYLSEQQLRTVLLDILDYLTVVDVTQDVIKKSLKSAHKDFEDGIQIIAAESIDKADGIITRNIKDFRQASINVYPPEAVMELII